MNDAKVAHLFIYPVKSCGAVELTEAQVVAGGLLGDRRYMLVDEEGVFITGRSEPSLLRVSVELCEGGYRLTGPDGDHCQLPTFPVSDAKPISARVWKDETFGLEWSRGSVWFSKYLGRRVRLLYMADEGLRPVLAKPNAPLRTSDVQVSWADSYPLLLTSTASLQGLNSRLEEPLSMDRFRPNLVVEGQTAFDEDHWAHLSIGQIGFEAPKLCDRCVMTTIDPQSGQKSKEPLRALSRFRRFNGAVWFGLNVVPQQTGWLRVGDAVRVLERRSSPFD